MLLWTFPLSAACCSLLLALGLSSLCRGGFFPADTPAGRAAAIDDNRRAVDEAAAIEERERQALVAPAKHEMKGLMR